MFSGEKFIFLVSFFFIIAFFCWYRNFSFELIYNTTKKKKLAKNMFEKKNKNTTKHILMIMIYVLRTLSC